MKTEKFDVVGMTCSACVAHVEKSVSKLPGIHSVQVNLLTNSMSVDYDAEQLNAKKIVESLQDAGYEAFSKENRFSEKLNPIELEQSEMRLRWWISFVFLTPVFYLSMGAMLGMPVPVFLSMHEHPLTFSLSVFLLTLPIYAVNRKFFINGFRGLCQFAPTMDSLVAIGAGASLIYGIYGIFKIYYSLKSGSMEEAMHFADNLFLESGATILSLVTLGKFLEAKSKRETSSALTKMIQSAPQTAMLVVGSEEVEVPILNVKTEDVVSIRSGQKIPVDGVIVSGSGIIDMSSLTGESIPEAKQIGDTVLSGSVNISGYFQFRAMKVGKDTTLAQIITLMEEASASKAPISKLADKISGIFVPIVIAISVLSAIAWLLFGYSAEFSLSIAVAVLIVSCPCALGLATPVAIMAGMGKSAELGVLFKSAEAIETGARIDTVLLDKTGTITVGKPKLVQIETFNYMDDNEILKIAASLEKLSEHPLANAVLEKADELKLTLYAVEEFQNKYWKRNFRKDKRGFLSNR
ncbi:MAG: heavy metal translocating P-type ATPase [Paludibacteraceae bacterium]